VTYLKRLTFYFSFSFWTFFFFHDSCDSVITLSTGAKFVPDIQGICIVSLLLMGRGPLAIARVDSRCCGGLDGGCGRLFQPWLELERLLDVGFKVHPAPVSK